MHLLSIYRILGTSFPGDVVFDYLYQRINKACIIKSNSLVFYKRKTLYYRCQKNPHLEDKYGSDFQVISMKGWNSAKNHWREMH